jgi:heme/copper-type cytochrome/quinol oxidase subunit 1
VLGFIAIFTIGGLSGVILASVQMDLQAHDTMFVVAHLHYVLIGGAVFPLFGAFHYWYPKWTGRMMDEKLGLLTFALLFVGFNLTFWPLHHLGLHGMTRRVYTYLPNSGWGSMNMTATIGAFILGLGVLMLLINMHISLRRGKIAGANPWLGSSLEWAAPSPPPVYNFLRLPTVQSPDPLWSDPPDTPVVEGLELTKRQVLVTTTLDAFPDHRFSLGSDSIIPLLLAMCTAYFWLGGGIFNPWHAVWGACAFTVVIAIWFWTSEWSRKKPQAWPRRKRTVMS